MHKRFFITFGLVALVLGGFALGNIAMVYLAGETKSYEEIATRQQAHPETLYGPLFNNDHASYKHALLNARNAKVVVAGSSRALQYRQSFFSRPMVNCGRIIASVRNGLNFFEELEHHPEVETLIVTMDFWWFRKPLRKVTGGHVFTRSRGDERSLDMFYKPAFYLFNGKIDPFAVVHGKPGAIGFRAIQTGIGFEADGSFFNPAHHMTHQAMVQNIQGRLGKTGFKYHKKLEKDALDAFFSGVERLKKQGKKVILLFPPMSPAMFEAVHDNVKFAYIQKTLEYAARFGAYNYSDPTRLGLTPKDFEDALHTTSRADAILLRDLAGREPALDLIIDRPFLDHFIQGGKLLPNLPPPISPGMAPPAHPPHIPPPHVAPPPKPDQRTTI